MKQIFVEKSIKNCLLKVAPLREFLFMGRKKAVVLLHWGKEIQSGLSICSMGDSSGQAKSRFLGGAESHDTL